MPNIPSAVDDCLDASDGEVAEPGRAHISIGGPALLRDPIVSITIADLSTAAAV